MSILAVSVVAAAVLAAAAYVLCLRMPGASHEGSLPPLTPELEALRDRLSDHVWMLSEEIGERNPNLRFRYDRAADYVEEEFEAMDLVPANQLYTRKEFRNISVDLYGRELRNEIIVIGAHYDTAFMTPGADDNASGVAGLLEIARILRDRQLKRTVRLVAFGTEEWPYFGRDSMGSRANARRSYDRGESITGMLSLEMIGYYDDAPGSQRYPPVIRAFFPERGNFIAFVGNVTSRGFLHRVLSSFRTNVAFPSEGLAAPQWLVPDIRRSDNSSFWYYDYPALMVTDTSNFRNRNYHRESDKHATLDYARMARVVDGLARVIEDLANADG